MPDEIAFLAEDVPASVLENAARIAAENGVTADRALISQGGIDEDVFYARLAAHLGLPFASAPRDFQQRLDWRGALATGAARSASGGALLAPRGEAIAQLLRSLTPGRHAADVAVTTPTALERGVLAQFGAAIAREAADDLATRRPGFSARLGANPFQLAALAALLVALPFEMSAGLALWAVFLFALGLIIFISVLVRLAATALALRRRRPAPRLGDADLPTYSVLVALYREAEVAPRLVAALRAMRYPAAKLEILLIVEADDAVTRDALLAQRLPPHVRVIVAPPGAPRTKPRALNIGLALARGDLVAVYDAEDRPDPDQLREAAAHFAAGSPKLACLQASLVIENRHDSWLTRLFALDYAAQFDVLLPGMSMLGLPFPLGGSSNHFRAEALRATGGWDAWNVTEDADLGLRLARQGYRMSTFPSATLEEAPPTLVHWCPQRRRWLKGWMQTLVTHTRNPVRLGAEMGLGRAAHALGLLVSNTFAPAMGVWISLYVAESALRGAPVETPVGWFWTLLAGLGLLSMLAPLLVAMARRRLWDCAPALLLRPAHWLCVSAASAVALYELWRRPFHWAKTPHGLSRTTPP